MFNWLVRIGLIEKLISEQNLDRSEGVSYEGGHTGNIEIQAEGTDSAKALRHAAPLKLKHRI